MGNCILLFGGREGENPIQVLMWQLEASSTATSSLSLATMEAWRLPKKEEEKEKGREQFANSPFHCVGKPESSNSSPEKIAIPKCVHTEKRNICNNNSFFVSPISKFHLKQHFLLSNARDEGQLSMQVGTSSFLILSSLSLRNCTFKTLAHIELAKIVFFLFLSLAKNQFMWIASKKVAGWLQWAKEALIYEPDLNVCANSSPLWRAKKDFLQEREFEEGIFFLSLKGQNAQQPPLSFPLAYFYNWIIQFPPKKCISN